MKPLRILHITGAMNRAGTETMLMNIYRNLDHEKVRFDFISYTSKEADYDQEIERHGGKVIRLSRTSSIKDIYNTIKSYGPYDAVHAHTLFHCGIAMAAAYLTGVPVRISHAHTTLDGSSTIAKKLYMKLMRRMIFLFSTNLLACSRKAGDYLFGENKNYSYFPNALDYTKFLTVPTPNVNKFKVEQGFGKNIVIGHIGRFIEAKNHKFLIEIMQHIVRRDPGYKLLLVGDGDLRLQIEEDAVEAGIYENIRFTGVRCDISIMMHSMDVFVFPSHYEGLGLVLLEAQACGVPAVVSEAIQPEADVGIGLINKLQLKDGPEIWANKIIELATKKERNITKIVNGFERSGYSLRKAIPTLLNLYSHESGGTYEKSINRLL